MATVTKGRTFVSGETVTPAKLNELVDSATVTAIQTADISDSAITNAKIASGVDASKLTTGTLPADRIGSDAITTARINNAAVTPAKLSQPYTLDTDKASTSGTSIDFTGIPSWAKRITVMFNEVSTNAANDYLVQIGDAGGIETSGYISTSISISNVNSTAGLTSTSGFAVYSNSAAQLLSGHMMITRVAGNLWVASHSAKITTVNVITGGGSKTLSDTLTQVRITTVNGTATFDAGTINIAYEG